MYIRYDLSIRCKGAGNIFFSLKRRPSCQMVSKAFATSKKIPEQYFLVSSAMRWCPLYGKVNEFWHEENEKEI
jgi:hypothetical protein